MLEKLTRTYHLHPIADHFTIALLSTGIAIDLIAAAAFFLSSRRRTWLLHLSRRLSAAATPLMIAGAAAAVLSYLTGDAEAERLWNTLSPGAQQILAAGGGPRAYLSHAILGQYLLYVFSVLAAWRVAMEFSTRITRGRVAYLMAAAIAMGAILYQGKTGGELVYEYGVGTPPVSSPQPRS